MPQTKREKLIHAKLATKKKPSFADDSQEHRKIAKEPRNSMHVGEHDFTDLKHTNLSTSRKHWGEGHTHEEVGKVTTKGLDESNPKSWENKKDRDKIQENYMKSLERVTPTETRFRKDSKGNSEIVDELKTGRSRIIARSEEGDSRNERHINFIKSTGGWNDIYSGDKK